MKVTLGWGRRSAGTATRQSRADQSFAVVIPAEVTQGGYASLSQFYAARVTREEAMSVPAVRRARDLVAGTLGSLPIALHGPDRTTTNSPLLDQPEKGVARTVSMARLIEDLLFEGEAWWQITEFAWTNFPSKVVRLDPRHVQVHNDGKVYVNGQHVEDKYLIRFDSPTDGLLTSAARAIATILKLDAAAGRLADEPLPNIYFTSADGVDPKDEVVTGFLANWRAARQKRSSAYVPSGLVPHQLSPMTAEQMQLADSRQHAVLEIARATGIDPENLGVSTTSRTYFNAQDRDQAFLKYTLGPFVSAIQDRLSMNDVTPRGYYAKFNFDAFLRTDTLSRYQAYDAGLKVGAVTEDEIRELEDKPALTSAQKKARTPAPAPAPVPQEQPVQQVENSARLKAITNFSAENDTVTLSFSSSDIEEFKADPEKRTVSGMLLPFNVQTSDDRNIRFAPGSVTWQKSAVSRIKLDREHDLGKLLGSATKVDSNDKGVTAAFKVARTPAGDEALALAADGALDGLSAVVRITDAIPDPVHEGGTLVTAAHLVRATLTAEPAFDDARLTAVALTKEGHTNMPDATTGQTAPAAPAAAPDTEAFTSAVNAFTEAVKGLQPQEREVVSAGNTAVGFSVKEQPVYTFVPGHGPSIVRDTFAARANGDDEAKGRLRKFEAQMAEFATVNRTVGANVIPPGYRPDYYVPQLFQGRPLMDLVSKGSIANANPFTIPKFGSATGATADHVEGTNPTDGTLALGTSVTVTPGAISGRFRITREIIDSSNPAIDAIALAAMNESYSQQTEGKVYTLLNGANGVGGTITSGFVPSGAAVVTATGLGSSGAAGVALISALRQQMVEYPFRRFAQPNRLALSSEAAVQLAKAVDSTGRPLLPRLGAMNASGLGNALTQAFDVDGLAGVPAWSMTGNAAGDADTIMFNSNDVWAWESPTLLFRYEEVAGPANVDLVLFGYFAAAVLRASGFSAVRLTVT